MPDMESPKQNLPYHFPYTSNCKKEINLQYGIQHDHFLQLPLLESPPMIQSSPMNSYGPGLNMNPQSSSDQIHQNLDSLMFRNNSDQCGDHVTDWRVLDKFVASQLSQEEISKENDVLIPGSEESRNLIARNMNEQERVHENASTSSSSWKGN
ncbi:hypothetical protein RD792_013687 [Penstemon davidsonii]|uniref:Uncharacterized protein n=1 Tax=Penstemon davidsonii TaxID=160366 RepID=A0ABR0CU69_9LAMI|nr:hypothetical protein RD792_013687 [Penstemon davidsonii]